MIPLIASNMVIEQTATPDSHLATTAELNPNTLWESIESLKCQRKDDCSGLLKTLLTFFPAHFDLMFLHYSEIWSNLKLPLVVTLLHKFFSFLEKRISNLRTISGQISDAFLTQG